MNLEAKIQNYIDKVTITTENGAVALPINFVEGLTTLFRKEVWEIGEELKKIGVYEWGYNGDELVDEVISRHLGEEGK